MREALEEGYVNYSSSLEILQQMRQELGITDDEHRIVMEELGIEDPELLDHDSDFARRVLESATSAICALCAATLGIKLKL